MKKASTSATEVFWTVVVIIMFLFTGWGIGILLERYQKGRVFQIYLEETMKVYPFNADRIKLIKD